MHRKLWMLGTGAAALAALALVGTAVALAASGKHGHTLAATSPGTPPTRPDRTPEPALTGDVLAKASAAAIAKVGGTVDAATTENDGASTAAAYEVHMTKADGTHVTVILDKGYAVLTVESGGPGGPHGWGRGGPGGSGESPLTGDTATKAKAAAVAETGGTADFASTENDSTNAGAAYEVHVTKADGSHVTAILDKDFNVLTVETH